MTAATIGVATEATATAEVNMNMRAVLRNKILAAWISVSDPIKNWFARHNVGSEKSRKALQDAFGYSIFAACWIGVTIALRLGFARSLATGASVMFVVIVSIEYISML